VNESLPVVLVVVGTDHHRFDRLVAWADAWLAARTGPPIRCVVQYGTSRAPTVAEGVDYLGHAELQQLMGDAHVVVCHGGPSTITESRRHGHQPIVVARSAALGEHVDDHQQRFSRWIAAKSLIYLVDSEVALRRRLDAALGSGSAPGGRALGSGPHPGFEAAQRFGVLVDNMLGDC
jgi:UDP-N-acetylglucosamine transferase subunit ALG13